MNTERGRFTLVRERAFSRNLSRFEEVLLALNSELHLPHGVSSMVDKGEYASIRKLGTMKIVIGGRRTGNLLPAGYNWIRAKKRPRFW